MNKIYNAIIVDDEKLARADLMDVLSEISSVNVVGEADSIKSAIDEISKHKPDMCN